MPVIIINVIDVQWPFCHTQTADFFQADIAALVTFVNFWLFFAVWRCLLLIAHYFIHHLLLTAHFIHYLLLIAHYFIRYLLLIAYYFIHYLQLISHYFIHYLQLLSHYFIHYLEKHTTSSCEWKKVVTDILKNRNLLWLWKYGLKTSFVFCFVLFLVCFVFYDDHN